MSTWRRKALELLPDKRQLIESAQSPTDLWIELFCVFENNVESNNEKENTNILKYVTWCTSDEAGDNSNETQQAVYCGFLEDIARNRKNFPLFKKWFTPSQFEKYKGSFSYTMNKETYIELENEFYSK